jgi:hypothetical protein
LGFGLWTNGYRHLPVVGCNKQTGRWVFG